MILTGNSISSDVSEWSEWEQLDPTLGMIRLDGLRPDTSYEVALRAENSQGRSGVGTRSYITDIGETKNSNLFSSRLCCILLGCSPAGLLCFQVIHASRFFRLCNGSKQFFQ